MAETSAVAEAYQPMPITVRVREACRLTGIGRSKLYELIAAGEIWNSGTLVALLRLLTADR